MSSRATRPKAPPVQIGALLRFGLGEIRARIYAGVAAAGFDDLRPSHVTLFRWPGPDGRRPTEVAAGVQFSKQRVNDLVRDLEARGYLRLTPDPADDRARLIRLTERGRRLHETAIAAHAAVEKEWAAAVGARRYAEMRDTLQALVTLPEAIAPLAGDRAPGRRRREG